MTTFKDLGLSDLLLKALPELGIENPTPIQEQSIPILINADKDFIGLAQTGTGKTAAYGLPALQNIDASINKTQALILTPTRELGQQVAQHINAFAKYIDGIRAVAVYGGASISDQIRALRKNPQIVVATPGRLIDLIERRALKISQINMVILDEADEMLNMGFKEDIDKILSHTPDEKYTWLFSATMPREIRNIVSKYMKGPAEVKLNTKQEVNVNIEHQYAIVKSNDKTEALKRFVDLEEDMSAIIFCRTRLSCQDLSETLKKNHYRADALHGDLSQGQRDTVMRRFKEKTLQIIVATDVAARGIDVNDLSHVIHYTLPDDAAYYTHRSGRTARAGRKGISLSLVSSREMGRLRKFQKELKIEFQKVAVPDVKDIKIQKIIQWARKIVALKPVDESENLALTQAQALLNDISKEDLISMLVANELKALNYSKAKDLNDTKSVAERKTNDRRSGASSRFDNFFINLGRIDEIGKKGLLELIVEKTNLKASDIGDIEMQRSIAFFEVDKKYSKKIIPSFKNVEFNGRKLRVNNDGPKSESSQRQGGYGNDSRGGGASRRRAPRRRDNNNYTKRRR